MIYDTYRGSSQAQPTHRRGSGFVMKVGNLRRTFDSCEVGGKCLEDKGTAKEPLPFLRSVKLLLDTERSEPYLFVVVFGIFVQKAKIFEVILCKFDTF